MAHGRLLILPALSLFSLACAGGPDNPSFPLTVDGAGVALKEMAKQPKPLPRPVVIVGGYLDPGISTAALKSRLQPLLKDDRILTIPLPFCATFDDCRDEILAAVEKAYPCDDPRWTTEVDVIGISMGGLAARHAAAPVPRGKGSNGTYSKRLRIARLFTISTPHRGAYLAGLPTFHKLLLQMRHGSDFLNELDAAIQAKATPEDAPYPIYPYVRRHDGWIGETNAAPPGWEVAWWVPNQPFQDAHISCCTDPRIIADVARRLRGETPFTLDPPAPLPGTRVRQADRASEAGEAKLTAG
jgi:pimeloyl-ACP methyl ester carboxylesterase